MRIIVAGLSFKLLQHLDLFVKSALFLDIVYGIIYAHSLRVEISMKIIEIARELTGIRLFMCQEGFCFFALYLACLYTNFYETLGNPRYSYYLPDERTDDDWSLALR